MAQGLSLAAPAALKGCATRQLETDPTVSVGTAEVVPYGSANATMLLPDGAPFLPPPQTITTYCLPLIV